MAMIEKEKKIYKCIPSTLELRMREYSETISTKLLFIDLIHTEP
jgi:hypothetical protein